MAVDKFRFLSPGIQVNEVDESRVEETVVDTGPVVIGRTAYGPAMTPVQVSTVAELNRVFGNSYNGKGSTGDVWRDGNRLAPTYATYAAEAFLANSAPVTVIRTVGVEHPNAVASGKGGWKIDQVVSTNASAGAWGIFVWPSGSTTIGTGTLGAVLYTSGTTPYLLNSTQTPVTGTIVSGVAKIGETTANSFVLKLSGASSSETVEFNFDSGSPLFVRKSLNTNPTKLTSAINATTEKYFLGESFEGYIKDNVTGSLVAAVVQLKSSLSNYQVGYQPAKSGWVVSQHFGTTGSFVPSTTSGERGVYPDVVNLFRFVTLNGGTWEQNNIKISIENVRVSPNEGVNPFPSFDVVVRDVFTDAVLEKFGAVNLNENSDNYIAKAIGDMYFQWDYVEERNQQQGIYPNNSARIRVEMSGEALEPAMLPFGFYGPVSFVGTTSGLSLPSHFGTITLSTGSISTSNLPVASPKLPLKDSNGTTALKRTRWGVYPVQGEDKDYVDYVARLNQGDYAGDYAYVPSGSVTQYSFMFTLDNVILTGSNSNKGTYSTTGRYDGLSLSAKSGSSVVLDYFNSFDLPLFGGTEGVDIRQKEAIVNNGLLAGADELTSCAFNALDIAMKMVADSELFETDIITIPGLTDPTLTDRLIGLCEERADSLALVDLENDYIPAHDTLAVAGTPTMPDVTQAISEVKARAFDTSYAASYYPAVYDASAGIFLPASIAALGVIGGTEGRSALWFAPAGFNRGGLTKTSSGLNVSRASVALTSKQRDLLYEVNINPIATFPREGVVIFGQKTLLSTPSALDRVNVRRLMNYVKRQVSRAATLVLFEPNVEATWNNFKSIVEPFLLSVKNAFGLDDFRVVLDSKTTTADLVDRNIMYAKIILKPTKAIEFVALDFVITNTGAVFTE